MIELISSSSDSGDLTGGDGLTVLSLAASYFPSNTLAGVRIQLGDSLTLDGTGGLFEVRLKTDTDNAGLVSLDPAPYTFVVDSGATLAEFQINNIVIASGKTFRVDVLSPNAADSNVDYSCWLYNLMSAPTNWSSMDVDSDGRVAIKGGRRYG